MKVEDYSKKVAYFLEDCVNSNLYTQEFVDKKDKAINDLLKRISDLEFEVEKQDKEIERLNNIINELEKYINEEYIYDELGMKIFDASKLQDKLQELKGSDK